jgi:DNA-binding transcriptional LysR family regulator
MQNSAFAGFNLNLLLVFEALSIEKSVSRAARRLNLTQPSVSNALSRLRFLVHDDLFVRTPEGMQPTARALELAEPIGSALDKIRGALTPAESFDPSTTQRQFSIGVSDNVDYALSIGLPAILQEAPHARHNIVDAIGSETAISMLDSGSIDVAVGLFSSLPKRFDSVRLYSEHYTCVARQAHPDLTHGLTLEKFVELPHLLITRDAAGTVDAALAECGLARRIAMQAPNFTLVPHLLRDTDMLAVVGERIGRDFLKGEDLESHGLPIATPSWTISAVWRRQAHRDEGIIWLIGMLRRAAALLAE